MAMTGNEEDRAAHPAVQENRKENGTAKVTRAEGDFAGPKKKKMGKKAYWGMIILASILGPFLVDCYMSYTPWYKPWGKKQAQVEEPQKPREKVSAPHDSPREVTRRSI